jgi:hypothetical protein
MKILLLDGTQKKNLSMVPMYLAQRYTTRSIDVISPDLDVLCQKYDSWTNIPQKEILATMDQTMTHVMNIVEEYSPDIIIGLNYGGCVLSNLVTDFYWPGNSVYLNPEGYFFSHNKENYLHDEDDSAAKSYWVIRKKDSALSKKSIEKIKHFKTGTTILVNDLKGVESIMSSGLLETMIESLCPTKQ